jgi:hypothetical protein
MGTQKSQEVEWEPPGSWGLTLADFLDVVDVGIGGVVPLEVKSVLLEDSVEFV